MSLGPLKSRPAKSDASQPLVVTRVPVRLMSTGITLPVTSPVPLLVKAPGLVHGVYRGELLQERREDELELELVQCHLVSGVPEEAATYSTLSA